MIKIDKERIGHLIKSEKELLKHKILNNARLIGKTESEICNLSLLINNKSLEELRELNKIKIVINDV